MIAAFRQHFVKTGIVEVEFSRFYGEAMEQRHAGDYGLVSPDQATADRNLGHAECFVERVGQALREMQAISWADERQYHGTLWREMEGDGVALQPGIPSSPVTAT